MENPINRFDADGKKSGWWQETYKDGTLFSEGEYREGFLV